jgi:hypothetical protein
MGNYRVDKRVVKREEVEPATLSSCEESTSREKRHEFQRLSYINIGRRT